MKIQSGDLFVSAVKGHAVGRFGSSLGGTKGVQIGVYPELETRDDGRQVFVGLRWDLDEIVRIPREEYLKFIKEYDEALRVGALKERKAEEHAAYSQKREDEDAAALKSYMAKRDEEAKKAQAEADALEKAEAEAEAKAKAVATAAKKAAAEEAAKAAKAAEKNATNKE